MLIDPYDAHWLDRFRAPDGDTIQTGAIYLLIDGVFVPGLHRRIKAVVPSNSAPSLLFESLPSCSDRTRDVSPFLVRVQPSNSRFWAVLGQCSGWPMICAIETVECQAELTERLAAWCVVDVDGQRFNFRFPDTRRLPAIFNALTTGQRAAFAGPATRWSYIDRSGKWRELAVPGTPCAITDRPRLDDEQFAKLVTDSEADEVLSILAYRGHAAGLHSQRHATVALALRVSHTAALDTVSKVAWCESCLTDEQSRDERHLAARLPQWIAETSTERNSLLAKEG
jgi:hypothetical protein